MAAVSGNQGKALVGSSTISELSSWNMDDDAGVQTYNAYAGAGWQRSVAGNRKVTGSVEGFYDPNGPIDAILTNGAVVMLRLYENATKYAQGYARLSKISRSANLGTAEPEKWSASFESEGAWSYN